VTKEGVIPSLPRREEVSEYYAGNGLTPPAWFTGGRPGN
jgi:hypothetical protein